MGIIIVFTPHIFTIIKWITTYKILKTEIKMLNKCWHFVYSFSIFNRWLIDSMIFPKCYALNRNSVTLMVTNVKQPKLRHEIHKSLQNYYSSQ